MKVKNHILNLNRERSKGVNKVGVPLDKNERVIPFNISTLNDLRKKLANNIWKYPDVDSYYDIFADWLNIDSSRLFFTEGVSGAIRNLMELYAETTVYYDTPTYAMYDVYAKIFRLIRDDTIDNADLIFVQNPNIPYGSSYSEDEIRNICSSTDKIVALDDVYFGFNVPDYLPLIDEYDNLVIMRSFSKAFGLASIRLGYIMSQEHNIKYISNNRNGYETNLLSLQTAHYFINHEELKDEYVKEMNNGRDHLIEELDKMNVRTQGGEYGNFIFIHTDPNNADKLANQGILVRKCINGIRLTLGPRSEMEKFIVVFRKI